MSSDVSNQPQSSRRPPPPRRGMLLGVLLFFSVLGNFFLLLVIGVCVLALSAGSGGGDASEAPLREHVLSGPSSGDDKVAVIRFDGVLMEGTLSFVHRQIESAAKDDHVKAVVLRINSPGGTITASDDLHRRLIELRDGNVDKKWSPKKLVVSMASMAASGGYYIAVTGNPIVAERTTITGSIGVYAAFPNIADLAKKYGFGMEVIKRGEVKDSGSMFKEMTPEARQVWDDMVGHAYDQFLAVVEEGRPKLKGKMRDKVIDREVVADEANGQREKFRYVRRRADGGIFTADEALKFDLIDEIGYEPAAIRAAMKAASLDADHTRVVHYDKPWTLSESLLGVRSPQPAAQFDAARLAEGAVPRLWYLAPGCELAGMLTAAGR